MLVAAVVEQTVLKLGRLVLEAQAEVETAGKQGLELLAQSTQVVVAVVVAETAQQMRRAVQAAPALLS
jgi:hypothetical protein